MTFKGDILINTCLYIMVHNMSSKPSKVEKIERDRESYCGMQMKGHCLFTYAIRIIVDSYFYIINDKAVKTLENSGERDSLFF